jgi:hypothetical protein
MRGKSERNIYEALSPHKSGLPPVTPFTRYFINAASVLYGRLRLWPTSPGIPQLDRSYPA